MPYIVDYTPNTTIAMAASAGIIFLVTLIVMSVLTMRIADFVIDSRIGALDRTLGFMFGAARGILLVAVAMLFFNWLVTGPQQPAWVADAKSKPLLDSIGEQLVNILPENADATILDRLRGLENDGSESNEEARARGTVRMHNS